ncbi:SH3 domain-binding glutamic acid-rich-like protein 3 [Exaiptasia diaphana]|uniref:SH3 domain-binding glutamic acid-rich-like protein n=1 Tax=Exaiptasia diaphana TaxID=2652724 RepID=A0A913X8Q7_EXADI|nr:SH3 domain-binding glutamic acid-rich-like protein 3 [Exaiptasia diaphana]KXJ14032.1 SH3 domain-binding glutamic acid-rich-like protein 3 [Exaiptasia diaphana]
MSAEIQVYISGSSGSQEIKKKQQRIIMILDGIKCNYSQVDISSDSDAKDKMREIVGDPHALPPQICRGDSYCGNYEAFDEAVESETLKEFLGI